MFGLADVFHMAPELVEELQLVPSPGCQLLPVGFTLRRGPWRFLELFEEKGISTDAAAILDPSVLTVIAPPPIDERGGQWHRLRYLRLWHVDRPDLFLELRRDADAPDRITAHGLERHHAKDHRELLQQIRQLRRVANTGRPLGSTDRAPEEVCRQVEDYERQHPEVQGLGAAAEALGVPESTFWNYWRQTGRAGRRPRGRRRAPGM